ncbi:carboxylesterase family protein [Phytohabitans houttuyneae]|uniref:Carboxylesterase type B domain-containing protein n=1 Tax=Phytohabitans houttuyneae TaxID=1076126 RepID=A0A6V8K3R7_9ACTN|nr:carboxylesterase family protein [Phytohabitans houttuyneae]GFJ76809.1 hypothetical protein Phou_009890 [Phytohabitans houttuyneae]
MSTSDVVVRTAGGAVRGRRAGTTTAFFAVPYAAAPVGPLRFAAPREPPPWSGVRDATTRGPGAPQPPAACRASSVRDPVAAASGAVASRMLGYTRHEAAAWAPVDERVRAADHAGAVRICDNFLGDAAESAYAFDSLPAFAEAPMLAGIDGAAAGALAGGVLRTVAAFVHTGDPSHAGIPQWPPYGRSGHVLR